MPTENATPDLPAYDAAADRGDAYAPTEGAPAEVELTAAELAVVGKEPEVKAEVADKGDEAKAQVAEPKAEEPKEAKADEEKGDEEKKDEKPRDEKTGKFIPKARFDEVNKKAKARVAELERQNADLRARIGMVNGEPPDLKALETDLETKSEEYGKLLADGDLAKAKDVMREINRLNRQIASAEVLAITGAHVQESQNVQSLSDLVDLYKAEYPVFDDQSEAYSQDYVDYVANLQGRFEQTGSSPAEALREAVELAIAKFGLDTSAPPADPAPPKPDKGKERKAEETAKNVKAANAQAPVLDKIGADSDKTGLARVDVNQLSYEQFCALSDSQLARLRGDLVS